MDIRKGRVAALVGGLACAALLALPAVHAARGETRLRLDAHEHALGNPAAPITVVEFTDYQCPFCRRFFRETWPLLKRDYVDPGKVRFIVRDLPLEFHAGARPAAEVVHCAGDQGKFWPMHAALLGAPKLDDELIAREIKALGLDAGRLRECVAAEKYEAAIARNAAQAAQLGIHGTPTFIVGKVSGNELAGTLLVGALPWADFEAVLREQAGD